MLIRWIVLATAVATVTIALAGTHKGGAIATMEELRFQPPKEKGKVEIVEGDDNYAGPVLMPWTASAR
jgi:hypothetical protein